jgi:hypothetical protein
MGVLLSFVFTRKINIKFLLAPLKTQIYNINVQGPLSSALSVRHKSVVAEHYHMLNVLLAIKK